MKILLTIYLLACAGVFAYAAWRWRLRVPFAPRPCRLRPRDANAALWLPPTSHSSDSGSAE
jgi:hypothetical protein